MNDLRSELLGMLGIREYNRFNMGLSDSARKGRLMTWVENLWNKFREKFPEAPTDLGGIIATLSGEGKPLVVITKEQFFSDPVTYFCSEEFLIEKDWITEAWQTPNFREDACRAAAHYAGKTGDFNLYSSQMNKLAPALKSEQIREFYDFIVKHSEREKKEWTPAFKEFFPNIKV